MNNIYELGIEAYKKNEWKTAINLLSEFCQNTPPNTTEYLKAQMTLVKAYNQIGHTDQALKICQTLSNHPQPKIKNWAIESLKSLTPSSQALTSEEIEILYISGNKALKEKRFPDAIKALEQFCNNADNGMANYAQAQILLVRAYQGNQEIEKAIALCQKLLTNSDSMIQTWAQQSLPGLSTLLAMQLAPQPKTTTPPPVTEPNNSINPDLTIQIKSIAEFKQFCQDNLISEIKKLEANRKSILKSIVILFIITSIITTLILYFTPWSWISFHTRINTYLSLFILICFLGGLLFCLFMFVSYYSSYTEDYGRSFKIKVIQKIVKFIDPKETLNYARSLSNIQHNTLEAVRACQIFPVVPDQVKQNDCIYGLVGETQMFFGEVCAETNFYNDHVFTNQDAEQSLFQLVIDLSRKLLKGIPYVLIRILSGRRIIWGEFNQEVMDESVERNIVFKGLFFKANFNKKFEGNTFIYPNIAQRFLGQTGKLLQGWDKTKGELIKLEDPEFSKYFIVYGADQVEARYILSTSLIDRLVKFRQNAKKDLYISFVGNNIYIAIPYLRDVFEPRLFKSMFNFQPLREYFECLQLMISVVQELNLNRRIWAK